MAIPAYSVLAEQYPSRLSFLTAVHEQPHKVFVTGPINGLLTNIMSLRHEITVTTWPDHIWYVDLYVDKYGRITGG